jgi:hypothetical protein
MTPATQLINIDAVAHWLRILKEFHEQNLKERRCVPHDASTLETILRWSEPPQEGAPLSAAVQFCSKCGVPSTPQPGDWRESRAHARNIIRAVNAAGECLLFPQDVHQIQKLISCLL